MRERRLLLLWRRPPPPLEAMPSVSGS
uniref:Uncharacterized protein n=1 Tax=Arundo donax TaxID=35708 RepID=A0A0A9D9B0_ARUDO